jgi:hypothetical protein
MFVSILSLALLAAPVVAIGSDIETGRADGEQDAKKDVNSGLWFAAGCLFAATGVGMAYFIQPSPPAMRLLGKSPEYAAAYTDAYRLAARNTQTSNAVGGCVVYALATTLVYVAYYYMLMSLYQY